MPKEMLLNVVHRGMGLNDAAWRHPEAADHAAELDISHYVETAKLAEQASFHSLFLADTLSASKYLAYGPTNLEPLLSLAAISQHTSRLGLIATISTSFYSPFHIARLVASLGHISGGRVGWNIVTSASVTEAKNFGLETLPEHDQRYVIAGHFVEAVLHLLDSWGPDALVRDKGHGVYADLKKIDYQPRVFGDFVLGGPLDIPPVSQGRPVLVQAGRSQAGIRFAGRHADVVFTAHNDLKEAIQFRSEVRAATAAAGRDPDTVKVLPGLHTYIGSTDAEAQAKYKLVEELAPAALVAQMISIFSGIQFGEDVDLDAPLPPLPDVEFQGQQGRYHKIRSLIDSGCNTLRKLQPAFGGSRGHKVAIGTPEQIVKDMSEWFDAGAVDGFSIEAPVLPAGFADFTAQVVPLLQAAGRFRTGYPVRDVSFRDSVTRN